MPRYRDDVDTFEERFAEEPDEGAGIQAPRLRRRSRVGEARHRATIRQLVRDLPSFVKLLYRLALDPRVSRVDKALVLATLAYMASPIDVIPDIPVIGHVDDFFLLGLALDRLVNRAGVDVLLDHWEGEMESLEMALSFLDQASSFLPEPVRSLLGERGG